MTGGSLIGMTGATGFVGSRLLPRLLERGDRVVCLLRPGRDPEPVARTGAEVRFADLADPRSFGPVFDGLGTIIHLSGLAQVAGMVEPLEAAGVRRGVFVSSTGVYTRLASPSAEAKRRSEDALRRSALSYTIVRPTMIYGAPGDRNMVRLLRLVRRIGVVPVPGGGSTPQQPVHVDDLVALILAALDRPATERREYDAGGPEALTLREVVQAAAEAVGRRARIVPIPVAPAARLVELARWARLPCPIRPEQVRRLTESKAVGIGDAVRDLGFQPRSFDQGITDEARALGWAAGAASPRMFDDSVEMR